MGSEGKLEEQLEQQQQEGKQFEEGKQLDDEKQLHKKKTRKPPLTRRKTENLNHVTRFIDMEEAVEKLVQQSIISTLNGKLFESSKVPRIVDQLNSECVSELEKTCSNFKYIVSTIIYEQIKEAGLHYSNTMYWDPASDASVNVSWDNGSIGCVVSVFGLAL